MLTCRTLTFVILFTLAATLLAGDDANNPHDLKTLAARQAWISLQRDLEKLDAQYQRDRQARINKAIVELETAKAKAAQAANADEIVRIDAAIEVLKNGSIPTDISSLNGRWKFQWGTTGNKYIITIRNGILNYNTDDLDRPLQVIDGRILMLERKAPTFLELILSGDRMTVLGWDTNKGLNPQRDPPHHVGIAIRAH